MRFSDRGDDFAAIVARLGDPEWRRLRRTVATVSAAVLVPVALILRLSAGSPWTIVAIFGVTFVVTLVGGLFVMHRRLFRRPRIGGPL